MRLAQAAKSQEISRLYTDSEQQVMAYATEVSRANRELARLEQAKTDFISIAAHELKTPLTLIRGYASILDDLEMSEQSKKLTDGIVRGTARMDNILEDMLDLSALDMRRVKLMIQPINLHKIIALVEKQVQHTLTERHQSLHLENLENLPSVEGDEMRLYQIFKQLFSNAIKFTPDGGQIIVSGQFDAPAGVVQIVFSDTGVGIAPEDHAKIFEKFYRVGDSSRHSTGQTKFMGAGPGLGLALVKGLVEAHGGQVTVDSPGFDLHNFPGSRFSISLPVRIRPPRDIDVQRLPNQPST
jgi:signal transduction histidine kinase